MNPERAIKRGKLSELNTRKNTLALAINGDLRAVKTALSLSSVTKIEDLEIDEMAVSIDRALENKAAYMETLSQIAELEMELNG